ncbi:helix-turn-helix domain-containing protein [Streptomyces bottropensis]|uniref:helix-turn-helix domain-containing protein n=1 Tax=Streptomyces bottropensis TaxID=42235 RepID=UPI003A8FD1F5
MTKKWARAALSRPAFCGVSRTHLGDLIEELADPWPAGCESALRGRRGTERQREAGAGPKYDLAFTDRVLVTLVRLRTGLPHTALAELYGTARSTISRAIGEIRPLLATRGFAVTDRPSVRLRTLADVFAYAEAEGIRLRIDGTETQVHRPKAGRPTTTVSDGQGRLLLSGRTVPAACTTRPRCALRASPSSSGSTRRWEPRSTRATRAWPTSSPTRPAPRQRVQQGLVAGVAARQARAGRPQEIRGPRGRWARRRTRSTSTTAAAPLIRWVSGVHSHTMRARTSAL